MTVETTTSRVSHNGAGTTGPFTIPFYFLQDADIRAIKVTIADGTEDELTLTTDFTLTGAGDAAGGELTLTSSLSSSYKLVIFRDPEILQEADYSANDAFPSETHEQVADRLTMIAQRFSDLLGRSVVQPDGDGDLDMRLPAAATRASKYLAFNADGEPVASSGTSESAVISTFAETLLDDETAAAARMTLGVPSTTEAILDSIVDAKGDLIAGSAADTPTRVAVGANGTVLVADSSATAGVSWQIAGFTTGDVKLTLKTTADSGWVLMDDKTIGDASSSATGRANADTEALFTLLWNNTVDADCAVSTGRGVSAAADFAAHKTIALPKALGRALAVYGSGSGLTARALAHVVGSETHTLTGAQSGVAAHAHGVTDGGHAHNERAQTTADTVGSTELTMDDGGGEGVNTLYPDSATGNSQQKLTTSSATTGISINNATAADAAESHPIMQPTVFLNVMIKL